MGLHTSTLKYYLIFQETTQDFMDYNIHNQVFYLFGFLEALIALQLPKVDHLKDEIYFNF